MIYLLGEFAIRKALSLLSMSIPTDPRQLAGLRLKPKFRKQSQLVQCHCFLQLFIQNANRRLLDESLSYRFLKSFSLAHLKKILDKIVF